MKVTLPENYRSTFTLEQLDIAKQIIRESKEDESRPNDYAEIASAFCLKSITASDFVSEIIKAEAVVCRCGMYEAYGEGYDDMNVMVKGIAKTFDGFLEFEMLLSDVWQICPDFYCGHRAWTRYYTRA